MVPDYIFTDCDLVVCLKPVGVDSEADMCRMIEQELGGAPLCIHRLDKNVGGVMVFARNRNAAAALSKAVQSGDMIKEYVAMVHGTPDEAGDWTDYLLKDSRKNKVFVVKRQRAGVREARLSYRRLSSGEHSLVRIRLYTGRSHQIRVQFSSRGFPLVGDHKYGSRAKQTEPMLYSCAITFPWKGKTLHFESLPPWAADKNPDCTEI